MRHSLLIMMYGQSNADAHNAGPAIVSPFLNDDRVVVPNDGRTWQGWRGKERTRAITGFEPAYDPQFKIQSIGAAMGASFAASNADPTIARVIVRSAAKGGRPLHGLIKDGDHREGIHIDGYGGPSCLFEGFVEDVTQMAAVARSERLPIRHVYIPFFHGEADRGTSRDEYASRLTDLMDEIDGQMCRLGLPTTWMMTQPSGTGVGHIGNGWENRLASVDVANSRPNAFLAATNYAYPLEDSVHLSARGKALIGEYLGLRMLDHQRGDITPAIRLAAMQIDGHQIDLHFQSERALTLDTSRFPPPDAPMGFAITGQPWQSVQMVEQTGPRSLRLTCALPLAGRKTTVDYAYRNVRSDKSGRHASPFPIGRGCLREDWSQPSRSIAGEELLNWVPGFSVSLDEAAVLALAA